MKRVQKAKKNDCVIGYELCGAPFGTLSRCDLRKGHLGNLHNARGGIFGVDRSTAFAMIRTVAKRELARKHNASFARIVEICNWVLGVDEVEPT